MTRRAFFLGLPAIASSASQPAVGQSVPDCRLVLSTGCEKTLSSFRGRTLALTFIFTRCPLPDLCPKLSVLFRQVQQKLKTSGVKDVHLLSLSFDTTHDTPERLREYASTVTADSSCWSFATGALEDVLKLGAFLGLEVSGEDGFIKHNLRTVVIDPQGRLQCLFTNNEWSADELVWELCKAARMAD